MKRMFKSLLYRVLYRVIRVTAETEFFWRIYRTMGRVHDYAAKNRNFFIYERNLKIQNISPAESHPFLPERGSQLLAYDVGMNNGDDTEYYLQKGLNVVGVEANPALCDICKSRFSVEINAGRLRIINCAVAEIEGIVNFFVNKTHHVLSTLVVPNEEGDKWKSIQVPARRLSSIIKEHGTPYYIKIDVEHYDQLILHDLLENSIIPNYISSESHHIDVFCHLVSMGYQRFKLVDGATVSAEFKHHKIKTVDGNTKTHAFKHHSAGPFGDDIPGPWLDKGELLSKLIRDGLGWKDIHAMKW
jgi:FkbM family methyltransferase